jgi:protein gp37
MAKRLGVEWGGERRLTKDWNPPYRWDRKSSYDRNKPKPRVFPSLMDWLDPDVPAIWLARFWCLMMVTRHVNWLLLTKRPALWAARMTEVVKELLVIAEQRGDWKNPLNDSYDGTLTRFNREQIRDYAGMAEQWVIHREPPVNLWIGASVENQAMADYRIPILQQIPAMVRFLSCEPLLGRVDIKPKLPFEHFPIDWMIVGGESGPHARPCVQNWISELVFWSQTQKVPCFVKQLGGNSIWTDPFAGDPERYRRKHKHRKGGDPAEWIESLRVRQFPITSRGAAHE